MENYEIKVCRLCSKEGYIFCDIHHEAIAKAVKLIPNLIDINDANLQHLSKVCTSCYQNIKLIIYNIETIIDTQKILRIENSARPKVHREQFQIEDITRKYTNIKVKKIASMPQTVPSPEKKSSPPQINEKSQIVVIETRETPKTESESPKKNRCLMCISCSEKFTDFEKLQTHLKTCNSSTNSLKCFCGKVMNSRKSLELHVYTQHKQNKRKHICIVCQKIFTSLFNLQNHMSAHKLSTTAESRKNEKKFNES